MEGNNILIWSNDDDYDSNKKEKRQGVVDSAKENNVDDDCDGKVCIVEKSYQKCVLVLHLFLLLVNNHNVIKFTHAVIVRLENELEWSSDKQ